MNLRLQHKDGTFRDVELQPDKPLTIGRSTEADVVVLDEKASRIHCGLRLWDGEVYVRDLKSRNGTFVNEQRVEVAKLRPGDQVRVGSSLFVFEQEAAPAAALKPLQDMAQEMAQGKGYSTILREIVHDLGDDPSPAARR